MSDAKPWTIDDPCPACGDELRAVPAPSDAQRAAAAKPEATYVLPPTLDHAPTDPLAELGALYRCRSCGYQSRVKPPAPPAAPAAESGAADARDAEIAELKAQLAAQPHPPVTG